MCEQGLLGELFVEDGEPDDWEGGEDGVVALVNDRLVQCLAAEGRREAEPVLGHHEQLVLVEVVHDEDGVAAVRLAPMVEEKRAQELELRDGVIRGTCSLHTLQPLNTDADMRLRNHIDIVGSVADAHRYGIFVLISHHLHNLGLLLGRDSAREHDISLFNETDKLRCNLIICEYLLDSIATDNHSHLALNNVQILLVLRNAYLLEHIRTPRPINNVLIDAII